MALVEPSELTVEQRARIAKVFKFAVAADAANTPAVVRTRRSPPGILVRDDHFGNRVPNLDRRTARDNA